MQDAQSLCKVTVIQEVLLLLRVEEAQARIKVRWPQFLSTNIYSILGLRFAFKPNITIITTRDLDLPVRGELGALDALSYGE